MRGAADELPHFLKNPDDYRVPVASRSPRSAMSPMAETTMYKVLKGFILTNGFEGKVDEVVSEKEFNKKEIASLLKDGSITAQKSPAKKAVSKKKK